MTKANLAFVVTVPFSSYRLNKMFHLKQAIVSLLLFASVAVQSSQDTGPSKDAGGSHLAGGSLGADPDGTNTDCFKLLTEMGHVDRCKTKVKKDWKLADPALAKNMTAFKDVSCHAMIEDIECVNQAACAVLMAALCGWLTIVECS